MLSFLKSSEPIYKIDEVLKIFFSQSVQLLNMNVCCLVDNQFRMSILERLEQMERRMAEMAGQQQQQSNGASGGAGAGGGAGGGGNGGNSSSSQSQVLSLMNNLALISQMLS